MVFTPSSAARPESDAPGSPPRPRRNAPTPAVDVTLPLRFVLAGLSALFVGTALLVAHPDVLTQYHYHPRTVALAHLFILGFLLSVVMGATYQLVPVVLETSLHSPRLARWHFPIHVVSVAGMIVSFWTWDMKNLGHFGSGLVLGACLFVWNMARTLRSSGRWSPVSIGIALSLVWLVAVLGFGIALTAAKSSYELVGRPGLSPLLAWPLTQLKDLGEWVVRFDALAMMHAHAHLGFLGVFVALTMAVAYRLVPMFLIGELQNSRRALASLLCVHAGVAIVVPAIAVQSPFKPLAALPVAVGFALYGWELTAIVRNRRRRSIDWGVGAFLASQALLLPVTALGLFLARPGLALNEFTGRLEGVYGLVAILGVVALAVLGMLHKILPFLVWYGAYGRDLGRARTPAMHELYSPAIQKVFVIGYLAAITLLGLAVLRASEPVARLGAITLALSLVALAANGARILSHLVRPRCLPKAPPRGPAGPASTTATP